MTSGTTWSGHTHESCLPIIYGHMNDVLIFNHTKEEHNARLEAALRCIQSAGVTLNPTKWKTKIKFLGHLINEKGIQQDPDKTAAIAKIPCPTHVQELK